MTAICLYFQVHQPIRLKPYSYFNVYSDHFYYDNTANRDIMHKIARKCYLPTNQLLLELISKYHGKFKIAFSITGTAIEQFKAFAPEVLASFKKLAQTGCVEFINETYYHSLSFIYSKEEFKEQVAKHRQLMIEEFNQIPTTFRNTELIYNNDLALCVEQLGFNTILAEGADKILDWRSSHYVYQPQSCQHLKLLLRDYQLADDIAFRFSNRGWSEYPLTADRYAHWVHAFVPESNVINLFMDYETFGEHQWEDTGIFSFLEALPHFLLKHPDVYFATPAEVSSEFSPIAKLDIPEFYSWADVERDLTAWLGNDLQRDAIQAVYAFEKSVKEINHPNLTTLWRTLQTSDHFYYMCTKWFADGDVHKYFNHYDSPYEAYINFQNVITDFSRVLEEQGKQGIAQSLEKIK